MNEYEVENGVIVNQYTHRKYSIDELCRKLNQLNRKARITQRDLQRCIELKAVNRMLRMENRFLSMKLGQLGWRSMNLDPSEIEKEVQDLCINPKEASEYIYQFERENFELKKKLRDKGEYSGDLL